MSEKRAERRVERTLWFLGEQDGKVERSLKRDLIPILATVDVQRAYLARVDFGKGTETSVALCLIGSTTDALVQEASAVFRRRFGSDQHLDICFISGEQELELRKVCRDFYAIA